MHEALLQSEATFGEMTSFPIRIVPSASCGNESIYVSLMYSLMLHFQSYSREALIRSALERFPDSCIRLSSVRVLYSETLLECSFDSFRKCLRHFAESPLWSPFLRRPLGIFSVSY